MDLVRFGEACQQSKKKSAYRLMIHPPKTSISDIRTNKILVQRTQNLCNSDGQWENPSACDGLQKFEVTTHLTDLAKLATCARSRCNCKTVLGFNLVRLDNETFVTVDWTT